MNKRVNLPFSSIFNKRKVKINKEIYNFSFYFDQLLGHYFGFETWVLNQTLFK